MENELVEGVRLEHCSKWGKPERLAPLLDIHKRRLEMDFVLEGDGCSMYLLNAASQDFTYSLLFSHYACDRIQRAGY
jgi:hypothetical protein